MMKLYLKVTKDKFELPEAVADSPVELSRMTGDSQNQINSGISSNQAGKTRFSRYRMVEVEDE